MMAPSVRRPRPSRPGKVLVWVVLSLAVIVGIVAINLDGGRLLEERRRVQAAADAAALAAGADLYENYWTNHGQDPAGTARAAAVKSAASNGLPAGAVAVNIPPRSGTFAGQAGYVEVIIRRDIGATFGRLFTNQDLPVVGRGVARGEPLKIGLILLAPSGAGAFLNKSLAFTMTNSPIIVNSSDPAAYDQPTFGVTIASRYDVTGGYNNSGGALLVGKMRTGVPPTPDPLAFLPIPSTAGAPVRSAAPLTVNSLFPTVLRPGIYQGGIHIKSLSIVLMLPGVYIMQGGGFKVDTLATVTALEVMVYNTTSGGYAPGPITVSGNVVMTAPLSGIYQGISLFQDRSLTTPISMTGVGLTVLTGVVYAAQAPVSLTGLVAVGLDVLGGAYVVNSLTVQGVGAVNIDLKLNPPRVPDVRLVE
ncbi:MAG TPA: hypothetical protein DDY78_15840 [Planctomycetales bacterium]|nr:hypothetical protein [Planctomycetales bacterium]